MSLRFTGWLAAGLAMLITLTLVVVELTDAGQRRWWAAHPLTTDTVAGLLVLLVTVLVVNQLLTRRQARQRGHAVAAQAAIMVAQAVRSTKALSSVIDGPGARDHPSARPGRRPRAVPRCPQRAGYIHGDHSTGTAGRPIAAIVTAVLLGNR